MDEDHDENADACRTCKDGEKFQACTKDFRQCAKKNCVEQCPKLEDKPGRLGPGKSEECKTCLKAGCGLDADNVIEQLKQEADEVDAEE